MLNIMVRGMHMKTKLKLLSVLSLIFLLMVIVIGCESKRKSIRKAEISVEPVTLREKNFTMTMRYLTNSMLLNRYGQKNNPFISNSANRIVVFELTIQSPTDAWVYLNAIELHSGGSFKRPIDPFQFNSEWQNKLRSRPQSEAGVSYYKGWQTARVKKIIDRAVMPLKFKMDPGKSYQKLLIFSGMIARRGTLEIYVPVYDDNLDFIHEFVF
jgi:hypothetical protein